MSAYVITGTDRSQAHLKLLSTKILSKQSGYGRDPCQPFPSGIIAMALLSLCSFVALLFSSS